MQNYQILNVLPLVSDDFAFGSREKWLYMKITMSLHSNLAFRYLQCIVLLYLLIKFSYSGSLCLGSRRVFNRFVLEALAPYDTPQSYLSCLTLIYGCVHTVSHQILHPRVGHAPLLFDLIKIMYSKYCKNCNFVLQIALLVAPSIVWIWSDNL